MVVRALTLFRTKLAERDGGSLEVPRFRAHLVKNVPSRAGLATGASNAATALWGANALCGSPASEAELAEWGAELGTEVAAFLGRTGSAYCTGRGVFVRTDRAEPLPRLPRDSLRGRLFVVTTAPPEVEKRPSKVATAAGVSTAAIFRRLADEQYTSLSHAQPADLLAAFASSGAASAITNDLSEHALHLSSELACVREALLRREGERSFDEVVLCGAGPSLLALSSPREGEGEGAALLAERVARECEAACEAACGVRVRVWPVEFAEPAEDGCWYSG